MKNSQSRTLCHTAFELYHMTPEEKAAYNRDYYQKHKDYWVKWREEHYDLTPVRNTIKEKTGLDVDLNAAGNQAYDYARKQAKNYGVDLDSAVNTAEKLASGEMAFDSSKARDILDQVSTEAADFLNRNKGAIASAAVDSLSKIAKASLNVGAAIGKEIVNRVKKSTVSAWKSGAKDIIDTGKSIVSSLRSKFGF